MEKRLFFTISALLVAAGALADAYTWTDEDGVVHYSDRPHPGAKIIDLAESSVARPRPTSNTSAPEMPNATDGTEPESIAGYQSLSIASPAAEETLWNIDGTLSVTLALTPALKPGHQVRVYFDGAPQTMNATSFQLEEVFRGVHNLQVEVLDQTGTLMIRSRPSRFYVQQNSVL